MNFWWVNHKQTAKKELDFGYIWSPKNNFGGGTNQSYINVTLAVVHDIIFSYAKKKISAVGIVQTTATSHKTPEEFGKVGDQWNAEGWLVQVKWKRLGYPFFPKSALPQITPLLPTKYSPIRQDGNGNQGIYLSSISPKLADQLMELIAIQNTDLYTALNAIKDEIIAEKEIDKINKSSMSPTTKQQLIDARIGQGKFRAAVEAIERHCRITGLKDKRFLVASHIKPWKDSTDEERLDGQNGFLLSPHVDKLFDGGYISFSDEGAIISAHFNIQQIMSNWGLNTNINVGRFTVKQRAYLRFHRENVFNRQFQKNLNNEI